MGDGVRKRRPAPTACVVEDDDLLGATIADVIGEFDVVVVEIATTLAQGRRAILTHRPDIAVVDNALPDGRGLELCGEIGTLSPCTSTVLYSGLLDVDETARARELDIAAVVPKSIRMRELREVLHRLTSDRDANGKRDS